MRILVTGFTPLQINSPRAGRRVSKINVPRALVDALRELGHVVDWRLVQVGEPIEDLYDLLLVNLAPAGSLNGRMGALGAFWALSRPLPTICHFDDWQVREVFNNVHTLLTKGEAQIYKVLPDGSFFFRGNAQDPELPYAIEAILDAAAALRRPWTRWLALCPMYAWGNKRIVRHRMKDLILERNFAYLDPTPLVINEYQPGFLSPDPLPEKERAWSLASLMPPNYWLGKYNFTWPVKLFGTNKKNVREGRTVMLATEENVQHEYAQRWGVLSPEYPQAGSGWFRSRFVYAAQVGTVLYCGPKDGASLGPAYQVSISTVEHLTDAGLVDLAARQRDTLLPFLWDKTRFFSELNKVIERAVDLAKEHE